MKWGNELSCICSASSYSRIGSIFEWLLCLGVKQMHPSPFFFIYPPGCKRGAGSQLMLKNLFSALQYQHCISLVESVRSFYLSIMSDLIGPMLCLNGFVKFKTSAYVLTFWEFPTGYLSKNVFINPQHAICLSFSKFINFYKVQDYKLSPLRQHKNALKSETKQNHFSEVKSSSVA